MLWREAVTTLISTDATRNEATAKEPRRWIGGECSGIVCDGMSKHLTAGQRLDGLLARSSDGYCNVT